MEMRSYRKMLHISCKEPVTNEEACARIQQTIGQQTIEDLLNMVKRRKLK